MKNNKIRLTESQLHQVIKESVRKYLNEIGDTPKGQFALGAVRGRSAARPRYHNNKYGSVPNKAKQERVNNMAGDEAWNERTKVGGFNNSKREEMNKQYSQGYNYGYEKGIKESVNQLLKESQEDKLRSIVGQMADQIHNMIDKLTMYDSGMNNYLADLCQNEKWIDSLYDAYYGMKEFAKSSAEREQEDEDAIAMPDGGYENFGY